MINQNRSLWILLQRIITSWMIWILKFNTLDISHVDTPFLACSGFGGAGRLCLVRADNFFVGLVDKGLHQYDVTISPELTLPSVCRNLMSTLVSEHQYSALVATSPLATAARTCTPLYCRRERKYKVTIKHTNLVSLQ